MSLRLNLFPLMGLLIVLSGNYGRAEVARGGAHRNDPRSIRFQSMTFLEDAAKRVFRGGLILADLPEIPVEVHLTDDQERPLDGEVEVVVTAGTFPDTGSNHQTVRFQDGRATIRIRPLKSKAPFLVLNFTLKGAPAKQEYYVSSPQIKMIYPSKIVAGEARPRRIANGKDARPLAIRILDAQGRTLPSVPFQVSFNDPEHGPTRSQGNTGSKGVALVKLPASKDPGKGYLQVRVGSEEGPVLFSNQISIDYVADEDRSSR